MAVEIPRDLAGPEQGVILRNGAKLTLSRNYREALNQLMGKLT